MEMSISFNDGAIVFVKRNGLLKKKWFSELQEKIKCLQKVFFIINMSDNNTYQKKKERLLERARNPYHQQGGTARTGRKLLLSTGYKKRLKNMKILGKFSGTSAR